MTQVPPRRLAWLREQVGIWHSDGLVDDETAAGILDRYEADTRSAVVRLAFYLGAAFVGIGLLWLVATNYEDLSPGSRFGLVAALWLGATVGGMTLEQVGPPLRLLGAILFGGVVFQAAQSLQVPAYEPVLLLAWAAGALTLAYASHSVPPLVVGASAGVGWYVHALVEETEPFEAFVLGLALAVPALVAAGAAHRDDRFAGVWVRAACLLGLTSLFLAAFPGALNEVTLSKPFYAGVAVALIATVVAVWRSGTARLPEIAAGFGIAIATSALALTVPTDEVDAFSPSSLSGAGLAWVLLAGAAFLLAAAAVAALGVVREMPGLVNLASVALVLFVTCQSFGLFSPLLSGAGLFLAIGLLLVVTGLVVDRGRRKLREVSA